MKEHYDKQTILMKQILAWLSLLMFTFCKTYEFVCLFMNVYLKGVMSNKEIKEESKDRKIRRHEVSFSTIQGNQSQDYLDGYLNKHSSQVSVDIVDQMVDKIDKKILRESLSKLQGQDKLILCQYLAGTKQNAIAERFGISPSAINQRLEKII